MCFFQKNKETLRQPNFMESFRKISSAAIGEKGVTDPLADLLTVVVS